MRVGDVREFASVPRRVVEGATSVDPEAVRQLLRRSADPLDKLTDRELQILGLMAEGHSNAAIVRELVLGDAAVGEHGQHPGRARPAPGRGRAPPGPGGPGLPPGRST